MSGFYPHGQRIPGEMDEEMARQYYASMGYQMPPPGTTMSMVPPTHAAGYAPAPDGRYYQNPYAQAMPPSHPAAAYHQAMATSQASYPGYIPNPMNPSVHAGMVMNPYDHQDAAAAVAFQQQQQRPASPENVGDLEEYGTQEPDGTWRCRYPGCSSKSIFTRACDLRKHFNRHKKYLFCRVEGCPQATEGGFSSKKDRARHEAKHNPQIPCEWEDCDRLFSRIDNMKDHVRRIHYRGSR